MRNIGIISREQLKHFMGETDIERVKRSWDNMIVTSSIVLSVQDCFNLWFQLLLDCWLWVVIGATIDSN